MTLSPLTEIDATASLATEANFSLTSRVSSLQRCSAPRAAASRRSCAAIASAATASAARRADSSTWPPSTPDEFVDQRAQLRMARVEMLRPRRAGRVEQRARVLGLGAKRRFEPGVGRHQQFFERLAAHDHGFVQLFDREIEPCREPVAMGDDGVGNAARARFDPLDHLVDALAEFTRQRLAGHRQPRRHRVAVQADCFGRLRAAVGDAADHDIVVGVERVAGCGGRGGELVDDAVGVPAQGFDRSGAARLDAADQFLVAAGEIRRQRLAGVADALVDVGDAADDLFSAAAAGGGEAGRYVGGDGADALDGAGAGAIHRLGDVLGGGADRIRRPRRQRRRRVR